MQRDRRANGLVTKLPVAASELPARHLKTSMTSQRC